MVEAERNENLEFKWGKRRGIGRENKDITFYESFTYDGVDYTLYDSVYLYKDEESEPYVGKLVRIWENPNKSKKVKILWFFRPHEIVNFLGSEDTHHNELFLASGEGIGLANTTPLESICGKCNVVCISKDSRNTQPSVKDVQTADFLFYRTFDVGRRKILEKLSEKIAGIEVKFLLNIPYKPGKEDGRRNEISRLEANVPSRQKSSDGNLTLRVKEKVDNFPNGDSKASLAKHISSLGKNYGPGDGVEKDRVNKSQYTDAKNHLRAVNSSERVNYSNDNGEFDQGPSKLYQNPPKKARTDGYVQLSIDKNKNSVQKLYNDFRINMNNSVDVSDSHRADKIPGRKLRPDEKLTKLSNVKMPETLSLTNFNKDNKVDSRDSEVTRRPGPDKSRWFKGLPWEERLKTASDRGTLVLFQNLDPEFTSGEVEDIVWHAFSESCIAKMIQKTAFSSPHSGQAYVIFKTREAGEKAVTKLDEGCLLLPSGRPLVGRIATPYFRTTKPTFFGHIVLDKQKFDMQRKMKDAVSTSHCSQANTIEYGMALEWCLLQEKSDRAWEMLHKLQERELSKLKALKWNSGAGDQSPEALPMDLVLPWSSEVVKVD